MKALNELNKLLKAYTRYSIENLENSLKFDIEHIVDALERSDILFPHYIIGISISLAQMAFLKIENKDPDIDALNNLNLALMYAEVGREFQLKEFKKTL
ncbi:hypothetical protein AB3515_13715 [Acinetobacter baumannii]